MTKCRHFLPARFALIGILPPRLRRERGQLLHSRSAVQDLRLACALLFQTPRQKKLEKGKVMFLKKARDFSIKQIIESLEPNDG